MKLDILQIGDPRLLQKSQTVTDFTDPILKKLVEDMIDTCEAGKEYTAGLAAPQVGHNLRLTVIRRLDKEKKLKQLVSKGNDSQDPEIKRLGLEAKAKIASKEMWEPLLNPELIELDEKEEYLVWEACLSIGKGESQIFGPVFRPNFVKVRYQDMSGNDHELSGTKFFSHLLQHEIDHLDGILFTSRVANPEKNLWTAKDLDAYMEAKSEYPPIV